MYKLLIVSRFRLKGYLPINFFWASTNNGQNKKVFLFSFTFDRINQWKIRNQLYCSMCNEMLVVMSAWLKLNNLVYVYRPTVCQVWNGQMLLSLIHLFRYDSLKAWFARHMKKPKILIHHKTYPPITTSNMLLTPFITKILHLLWRN